MSSSRIATLLTWCAENRIQIDPRIQIIDSQQAISPHYEAGSIASEDAEPSRERGLAVYSREELIDCAHTLVHIPKTAVLSVKSCFFSQHISSVPYGHGAHLSLALALYGELLLGPRSRWSGYLESLPRETVDIAVFWGVEDAVETRTCTCSLRGHHLADKRQRHIGFTECPWCVWLRDNQNAREWLQVTEIDREQAGLMEEIRQYYYDVVEPMLCAASTNFGPEYDLLSCDVPDRPGGSTPDSNPSTYGVTLPGFCHAYSLVSTRAFWVDAFHGLAMVPIADAFNHTNDNHVQMESDYDVCVECGSLAECEHDCETRSTAVPAPPLSNVHPLSHDDTPTFGGIDYLEMRSVRPIPPFCQVFNTYGSLSNATLLSRYGFTLSENEHDTVRMVLDPLSTMNNLFNHDHVGLENGDDDHAVTSASDFRRLAIRNACRVGNFTDHGGADSVSHVYDKEQQPCGQGIEATPSASVSVGAWESSMNHLLHVFAYVAGTWSSDAAWEEQDGLVFNPQSSSTGQVSFRAGDGSVRISHDLVVNSDGKISHNLWLFCVFVALFASRSRLGASFEELKGRIERGPESISSLTDLKARLISVQRYIERLRHIHDRDSLDGDMEDGGNQGSTSSPPLPHPAPLSLKLDYDTEPDEFAQPAGAVQVMPRPAITPAGTTSSISAGSGSSTPHRDLLEPKFIMGRSLETGPRDPEITKRFSPAPQGSSELPRGPLISCHPVLRATGESYQETTSSSMATYVDRTTGYRAQRDRSRSAERERSPKRARRSDSIVATCVDRLGRVTPDSTQQGRNREGQDASDEDDVEMTDPATHHVAFLLAHTVVRVCHDRYRSPTLSKGQQGIGMTAAELGNLLDSSALQAALQRQRSRRPRWPRRG